MLYCLDLTFNVLKEQFFLKNTIGKIRAAIDKYSMIKDGDKIAIGVSGGKDSVALLWALSELRNYYPNKFEIVAITIDPYFNGLPTDYSEISDMCSKLGIQHIVKKSSLWEIVFKVRNEKNPCSLCSKMRRGMLHNVAVDNGCNVVALGHHLDDAVQTFFMNLFNGGKIGCFAPLSYLSVKKINVIRPLIFCHESEIISTVNKFNLPVCKSECPVDGATERKKINDKILEIEKSYPKLRKKVISAMKNAHIDNW